MTPINPAVASGLPANPYDSYGAPADAGPAGSFEETVEQALPPHVADGGAYDPAYAEPSVTGGGGTAYGPAVDPYATAYDPYAAAYESAQVPTGSATAVAPQQPGLGIQPASVEDFAALGVFTHAELLALLNARLSPSELGAFYADTVSYLQSPEGQAELQQRASAAQAQGGNPGITPPTGAQAPVPASAEPGWNKDWSDRFKATFKEQGLDSMTQMVLLGQLKKLELPDVLLEQLHQRYSTTPAGAAELKQLDQQVRDGQGVQGAILLGMGALTLGLTAIPVNMARSQGNLVGMLERTAKRAMVNGADDQARTLARVLGQLDDPRAASALRNLEVRGLKLPPGGATVTSARAADGALDAAAILRGEARVTKRYRNPITKMQLNGAARHLTPSTRLPAREALKYGLGMRFGDAVADTATAATAASTASRATSAASAASATVTGGGAATAARGAGMLSRGSGVMKALGPIGLVAGTALGAWTVSQTVEAEGGFGRESAKMTGNVAGGLAGGIAGAAAGAAIGSVVPVIGTGIGAIAGGIIGGLAGSWGGEQAGGGIFDMFD